MFTPKVTSTLCEADLGPNIWLESGFTLAKNNGLVLFSLNVPSLGYTYVNWEQFNLNLPMTKSLSTDLFNKIKCNEFV